MMTDLNQQTWSKAKSLIPGGNMLLSKRPELFLPSLWPTYYNRAKGCEVWDLNDNKFTDVSLMGVGTNILGYANSQVDEEVINSIHSSNMSTLNSPHEVYLAEELVNMHSWADMVRFARTGGEANAIAIRIARAFTQKDVIGICGYHGWHDWYLSCNLQNSANLNEHLLPGLSTRGVPDSLKDSVRTFSYNNIEEFDSIIDDKVAAIKMEVQRSSPPAPGFLEHVRRVCTEKNIILIFDECTSGFRETYGGLHLKYGIYPDMAVFGKALGNGYPITCVLGKSAIMDIAQSTFISSTFWTDRIGSVAALKTLELMKNIKSWEYITSIGQKVRQSWRFMADKYGLPVKIGGIPALSTFTFESSRHLEYKTYISQEMLKKGYLASNVLYTSIAHTDSIIQQYISDLESVFAQIANFECGKLDIESCLETKVCHSGFKRLN